MRKWIIPLAVLMVVPALGAAAPIAQPPEPESLVEGHTVFTVIEQVVREEINEEQYAAAVAVLVREVHIERENFRFPGVLWFNDQYLVNPRLVNDEDVDFRFPCTGAVLAVNAGAGDPVAAFAAATPVYDESYQIIDPNDHVWIVDKWVDPTLGAIWVVPILNNQATISVADDGESSCAPVDESELALPLCPLGEDPTTSMGVGPLRCNDAEYVTPAEGGNAVSYNALLYFLLADLTVSGGVKDHNEGSADYTTDVSGCDNSDPEFAGDDSPYLFGDNRGTFDCPNGDDNLEGNSHPYNPFGAGVICPNCAGLGNHGGSGGGPNLHAVRNVDIFYGTATLPILRDLVVTDTEGSTAPFHCHGSLAGSLGCADPAFPQI